MNREPYLSILNNTRPDLVIMTGDQLKGYSP